VNGISPPVKIGSKTEGQKLEKTAISKRRGGGVPPNQGSRRKLSTKRLEKRALSSWGDQVAAIQFPTHQITGEKRQKTGDCLSKGITDGTGKN